MKTMTRDEYVALIDRVKYDDNGIESILRSADANPPADGNWAGYARQFLIMSAWDKVDVAECLRSENPEAAEGSLPAELFHLLNSYDRLVKEIISLTEVAA